ETTYDTREKFKNATNANEVSSYAGDVKKYAVNIPFDASNQYLLQRVTVENITLDMRWSADTTPDGDAKIENIIARATDRIRVLKNQRTYGVISHFGYGIGVYDLNAIESNDFFPRPTKYKVLAEQVILTRGKHDPACFVPT